jgi:hypothetical protein
VCSSRSKELDATINNKGLLLLNIWELEALIFADITTFNKLYNTTYKFSGDQSFKKNPKEELKRITFQKKKKFNESDCPEIFENLNFNTVENNCNYFADFITDFNKKIK